MCDYSMTNDKRGTARHNAGVASTEVARRAATIRFLFAKTPPSAVSFETETASRGHCSPSNYNFIIAGRRRLFCKPRSRHSYFSMATILRRSISCAALQYRRESGIFLASRIPKCVSSEIGDIASGSYSPASSSPRVSLQRGNHHPPDA